MLQFLGALGVSKEEMHCILFASCGCCRHLSRMSMIISNINGRQFLTQAFQKINSYNISKGLVNA